MKNQQGFISRKPKNRAIWMPDIEDTIKTVLNSNLNKTAIKEGIKNIGPSVAIGVSDGVRISIATNAVGTAVGGMAAGIAGALVTGAPSAFTKLTGATASALGVGAFEKGKMIALEELKGRVVKANPLEILGLINFICELNPYCAKAKKAVEYFVVGFVVKKAFEAVKNRYVIYSFDQERKNNLNMMSRDCLNDIKGSLDLNEYLYFADEIAKSKTSEEAKATLERILRAGKKGG